VAALSEFHFHRLSRVGGKTPKSFVKFMTANHAKKLLSESRDVLSAAYESGLSGPSRLHDLMITVEAVTPGEFKSGGAGLKIHFGFHQTRFGECLIAVTKRGLCHFAFGRRVKSKSLEALTEKWFQASVIKSQSKTKNIAANCLQNQREDK